MNTLARAWQRFWFTPTSPYMLGLCRFCFFAAFYGLYIAQIDLRDYALFPEGFYQPRSFFAWLPFSPPGWDVLNGLVTAFTLAVILAALGLCTRVATATSCVLGLYVVGLQFNYGYLHWAHAVVPLVMGVLALAPCGDALSLDTVIRRWRTQYIPTPGGQYRWPIQLVRLLFVTVFLAAGLAKLRTAGLTWITSDTLRHYFLENAYVFDADATAAWSQPLVQWLVLHPGLCKVLAAGVIIVEVSAPAALFSAWARRLLLPILFLFQLGNTLLLYQNFFFAYLGLYIFWLPCMAGRQVGCGND